MILVGLAENPVLLVVQVAVAAADAFGLIDDPVALFGWNSPLRAPRSC
jgi:hypothetical protein